LAPAELWAALHESGLVGGPPPREGGVGPLTPAGDGVERFLCNPCPSRARSPRPIPGVGSGRRPRL